MEGIRAEVPRTPDWIEGWSADRLLRFRDEWVRNRAREIRQGESASFKSCSGDTASVTALNEFYRWRIVEDYASRSQKGHLIQ